MSTPGIHVVSIGWVGRYFEDVIVGGVDRAILDLACPAALPDRVHLDEPHPLLRG